MAKRIKDKYLIARIDTETDKKVAAYVKAATEIDGLGDLLRRAVTEYMENHPI